MSKIGMKRMYKKRIMILVFMLLLVFVGACSDQEKGKNETDETKVMKESEEDKPVDAKQFKKVSLETTRDALKKQISGTLVSNLSVEKEVSESELDQSMIDNLTKELTSITNETKDPDTIFKGIGYLLASPHYKETITKVENFEPNFEDPYLPTPESSVKEEGQKTESETEKAIILLDASSSMLLKVDNKLKMNIAKEAVKRFAETIGQSSDVSLVVYGHKGSEAEADKELSCTGIEEIYPMGNYEKESFEKSLIAVEGKGWTPLAGAIKKAAEMSEDYQENVTVYIVSDGVETCGGDPVKEAQSFVKNNEHGTVNIIGFHVDQDAENQLKKVSEAGNGDYYSAKSADDLKTTIETEWLPSDIDLAWAFTKAPGPWEELDEYKRLDKELEPVQAVMDKEQARFDKALEVISNKEMIDTDTINELNILISDRYKNIRETISELHDEKRTEAENRSKDIRAEVDAWVEKMKKLKKD